MINGSSNSYYIRVKDGSTFFILPEKGEIIIGRSDPALNILPDVDLASVDQEMGISRRHAKLVITEEKITLEDLDSTNGTYVDLQKVVPRVPLIIREGQEIRLANVAVSIEKTSDGSKNLQNEK